MVDYGNMLTDAAETAPATRPWAETSDENDAEIDRLIVRSVGRLLEIIAERDARIAELERDRASPPDP